MSPSRDVISNLIAAFKINSMFVTCWPFVSVFSSFFANIIECVQLVLSRYGTMNRDDVEWGIFNLVSVGNREVSVIFKSWSAAYNNTT